MSQTYLTRNCAISSLIFFTAICCLGRSILVTLPFRDSVAHWGSARRIRRFSRLSFWFPLLILASSVEFHSDRNPTLSTSVTKRMIWAEDEDFTGWCCSHCRWAFTAPRLDTTVA